MIDFKFIFDFGSPKTYLVYKLLPGIEKRTNTKAEYVPVLLGGIFKSTNNVSPIESFKTVPAKGKYDDLDTARFVKKHNIPFNFNSNFPINTLNLMRGAIYAQENEIFDKYVEVVFKSMWVDNKKMDDLEVIQSVLLENGLPVKEIFEGTQDQEIKDKLIKNTSEAVEKGVFGAPSLLVNNELFFGKETLQDVEELLVRETG
jgi:2-hydroxychromene-2-carboxylate isomerase